MLNADDSSLNHSVDCEGPREIFITFLDTFLDMLFFCIPFKRNKQSNKISNMVSETKTVIRKVAWGPIIKGLFCV